MKNLNESICRDACCPPGQRGKKFHDGDGLYLWVSDSQRKTWRFRYKRGGKQQELTIGHYPGITLRDARSAVARERSKLLLDKSYNPAVQNRETLRAAREAAAAAVARQVTFKDEFLKFAAYKARQREWGPMSDELRELFLAGKPLPKNHEKTTELRNRERFERHLKRLADRPIAEITPEELTVVLDAVEAGNERKKVRGLVTGTFKHWLAFQPYNTPDPCRNLRLLTKRKAHVKGNHAAITDPREFGLLVRDCCGGLDRRMNISAAALLTQIYLFQRSRVVESMRWDELHFELREWHIPLRKMKSSTMQKLQAERAGLVFSPP